MLDLSNNNGTGHDFHRAFVAGQRRAYFKATEGVDFDDRDLLTDWNGALRAGFRVGAYHFAHGRSAPEAEAAHFLRRVRSLYEGLSHSRRHHLLRPCLDLESSKAGAPPTRELGQWALAWLRDVERTLGVPALVYGSAWFLEACKFPTPPAALWLAAYGSDDGREHPYRVPAPWQTPAAHQYADNALVPGIRGRCDISHVLHRQLLDL